MVLLYLIPQKVSIYTKTPPDFYQQAAFYHKTSVILLHSNELIFPGTKANFFGVLHTGLPVTFRRGIDKVVMVVMEMRSVHVVVQEAPFADWLSVTGISAGHIQRDWIERGKHTNVWNNWNIIFPMAVAEGRYIHDNIDVELRTPSHYRFGIFRHFHAELFSRAAACIRNCVDKAGAYTAAASNAFTVVN